MPALFAGYFPGNGPQFKLKRMGPFEGGVRAASALRSLSRLRGRAGVGVLPRRDCSRPWQEISKRREPPPAALFERVDLPRKRER
ncbi:hypothetical protein UNPF46_08790 [Bradyrhizobium sp. UNPF46]|nr:hypothetical protein UNPF46_08790 [Bradyrhizobium sp. UNPF46]